MAGEEEVKIQAQLIEQDHRPFKVVSRFLTRNEKWPDRGDPRRSACETAMFWLLVSPSTIVVGGGSIIAVATLVLYWIQSHTLIEQRSEMALQTEVMREQNRAVLLQNSNIQFQIHIQQQQFDQSTLAEAIRLLWASPTNTYTNILLGVKYLSHYEQRNRIEALRALLILERKRIRRLRGDLQGGLVVVGPGGPGSISLAGAQLQNLLIDDIGIITNLHNIDFGGANLSNTTIGVPLIDGLFPDRGRIANLTNCDLSSALIHNTVIQNADLAFTRLPSTNRFVVTEPGGADFLMNRLLFRDRLHLCGCLTNEAFVSARGWIKIHSGSDGELGVSD